MTSQQYRVLMLVFFASEDLVVYTVQVNPDVLKLLLDYCRFHRAPGRSDKVGREATIVCCNTCGSLGQNVLLCSISRHFTTS